MFGKSLRYTGYGVGYDETIVHGSLEELKFVVYYLKQSVLVAVASLNRDPVATQVASAWKYGKKIVKADIEKNSTDDWSAYLH